MDTTIQITGLPETVIEKLGERAEKIGATTPDYVRYLIEEDLVSPMSARVLYAPVREQVRESGISEDDLGALIEEARDEVYREKFGSRGE